VPQAEWPSYRLTTVEQPLGPMIEATVDLLQRHLRRESASVGENVTVPGDLIIRESVRQAPSAQAGERRRRVTSSRGA
jgi:LacI family transcriptional regulator